MQTRLSLWAAALAARLPRGLADSLLRFRPLTKCGHPVLIRPDLPLLAEEAGSWGCGWFDSSHELVHGLQVEEDSAEAVSALPLVVWLDLECRSAGMAAPSA